MLTGTAVVRNRMPGGVGGRREQSRLLPDGVPAIQAYEFGGGWVATLVADIIQER